MPHELFLFRFIWCLRLVLLLCVLLLCLIEKRRLCYLRARLRIEKEGESCRFVYFKNFIVSSRVITGLVSIVR